MKRKKIEIIQEKISHYTEAIVRHYFPNSDFLYLFALKVQSITRLKPKKLLHFEVNIVDHCNLNCVGCEHFSPLVKEGFINTNKLEQDFQRLSNLTGGTIETLHLMGGEPLLHPDIVNIIKMSRLNFKKGTIKIVTNGILLTKMPKEFWETCKSNDIIISVTKYPIKLDTENILKLINEYELKFEYYNIGLKTMQKRPLDLSGQQSPQKNFKICHMSNTCIQLRDGKLYTCAIIPYIHFFNNFFDKNIQISSKDYIDIYEVQNMKEVYDFLCKPVPFCRYCNINAISRNLEWKTTKYDIKEWV